MLENDKPLSVVPYISELLDDGKLDILMYNGDLDLACNAQGTELALESMDWSGKREWLDPYTTKWHEWIVDGQAAGHTKKFKNLEFLVVYNSGHFVPINQAQHSLNMIGRLLDGKSMGDKELPQFPLPKKYNIKGGTITGEKQTTKGIRGGAPLLPALCGFLLGVMATYFWYNRHASREYSTSSSNSSFEATEATPLHHGVA